MSISSDEPAIRLHGISKHYANTSDPAVDALTLDVQPGTLLALLGPSGCGKSTTLRLIAGLEVPDAGDIWLAGRQVASASVQVPPETRRVGMVFQDYALFPHLTIGENVAFPLNRIPTAQRRHRVARLLEMAGLDGLEQRYPHELSGGQQQRVALARALAADPAVVLLDEPFSNLDAALRTQTREEVRAILKSAGMTTILVTHDQEEALSIADRVAVMRKGILLQEGPPREIYLQPAMLPVATFVGEANVLPGKAHGNMVQCILGRFSLQQQVYGPVHVLLRPEVIGVQPASDGPACIERVTFFGTHQQIGIRISDDICVQARVPPDQSLTSGMMVRLVLPQTVLAFPK